MLLRGMAIGEHVVCGKTLHGSFTIVKGKVCYRDRNVQEPMNVFGMERAGDGTVIPIPW